MPENKPLFFFTDGLGSGYVKVGRTGTGIPGVIYTKNFDGNYPDRDRIALSPNIRSKPISLSLPNLPDRLLNEEDGKDPQCLQGLHLHTLNWNSYTDLNSLLNLLGQHLKLHFLGYLCCKILLTNNNWFKFFLNEKYNVLKGDWYYFNQRKYNLNCSG